MSDAALDAAARALARRLLRDLPADRPRTRADVDRLPSPVARLLHAHLDAQAAEATSMPASPYVDPEADGVRAATQTWRDAVRDAVRVPADVWAPAVEDAARRAVYHLVRPAEALAAYAFEGEAGPLDATAALARTRAFGPYGYLPEIAGRYVERKEIGRIDRYGLELLLRRIDRRMVSAFGPDEWAELLAPLVALVGPDGEPDGAVPADLLRALFREKDVHPPRDVPEAASADDLRAWLDDVFAAETAPAEPEPDATPPPPASSPAPPEAPEPDDAPTASGTEEAPETPATSTETDDAELLAHFGVPTSETDAPASGRASEALLPEADHDEPLAPPVIGSRYNDPAEAPVHDSDVLGPARAVEPSAGEAGAVIFPHVPDAPDATLDAVTEAPEASAFPGDSASVPTDEGADEEPLWKRIARERGAEAAPPEPSAEPDPDPLWKRFAAPAADAPEAAPAEDTPAPPDRLDALEARVLDLTEGDERRDWFVADLFRDSPSEYHRTLAALDASRSYTEATKVIEREVFRKHRINPYTDAAVAFVDAVQAQFTRQGRG